MSSCDEGRPFTVRFGPEDLKNLQELGRKLHWRIGVGPRGPPSLAAVLRTLSAVLKFLDRDRAWLALLRVDQQILSLRALLARERRAKARPAWRAPARARKGS